MLVEAGTAIFVSMSRFAAAACLAVKINHACDVFVATVFSRTWAKMMIWYDPLKSTSRKRAFIHKLCDRPVELRLSRRLCRLVYFTPHSR